MSFSAGWLTLREPYDRRARNAAVLSAVAAWAAQRPSVAVVDLACGLGSTLRGVTERLSRRQSWRQREAWRRWERTSNVVRRGQTHPAHRGT